MPPSTPTRSFHLHQQLALAPARMISPSSSARPQSLMSSSSSSSSSPLPPSSPACRLTVIPFVHSAAYPPSSLSPSLPVGHGFLVPFPSSHSSLLFVISSALGLPADVERSIRLFIDEGADDYTAMASRGTSATSAVAGSGGDGSGSGGGGHSNGPLAAHPPPSSASAFASLGRKGGELSARTFCLLRDNDVLHAAVTLTGAAVKHQYSAEARASHTSSNGSGSSAVDGGSGGALSSSSSAQSTPGSTSTGRVEVRVLDVSSGAVLRFEINPRKRLQQLMNKYEQHEGWTQGSSRFTCKRTRGSQRSAPHAAAAAALSNRQEDAWRQEEKEREYKDEAGEEEEVELSGQETCESLNLSHGGALLLAYKRLQHSAPSTVADSK